MGEYEIDKETNRPKNPEGRTGCMFQNSSLIIEYIVFLVSGRGLLGRWGPNHAGDPVVTRWAKTQQNQKHKILEVILINRKDSGDLALPGGMVDAG
jgi:ADP-ribose pyrophosphatase